MPIAGAKRTAPERGTFATAAANIGQRADSVLSCRSGTSPGSRCAALYAGALVQRELQVLQQLSIGSVPTGFPGTQLPCEYRDRRPVDVEPMTHAGRFDRPDPVVLAVAHESQQRSGYSADLTTTGAAKHARGEARVCAKRRVARRSPWRVPACP